MMSRFVKKLGRAMMRHGIIGMMRVAAEKSWAIIGSLQPSVRAEIRKRKEREASFDKQFGVDTAGCIHPTNLNINSPNQLYGVSYGGSDPKYFRKAIEALPIDYSRFVFIDFGSGKGRAILMAADFPFKRIVGVEYSEELHRIAEENIRRFNWGKCKCEDIELKCIDAIDYPIPHDCIICYFCNPFGATVMTQILSNIQKSLFINPREIFIVYYNPKEGHLVNQEDYLNIFTTIGPVCIWRSCLPSQVRNFSFQRESDDS